MVVLIDRIEGDFAVVELENLSTIKVPKALFDMPHEGAAYKIEKIKNPVSEEIKKLMNEVFDD